MLRNNVTRLRTYETKPNLCRDHGGREKAEIFNFTLLCGASKGFMKTFKVFTKPFEAPQRSIKKTFKAFIKPFEALQRSVKVKT